MRKLSLSFVLAALLAGACLAEDRVVVVADAAFSVIDLDAKDLFLFSGPSRARLGTVVGVDGRGREVRVLGPAPAPAKAQAPKAALRAEVPAGTFESRLSASCAACHTKGAKVRGGFVLFEGGKLQGKEALAEAVKEIDEGRMPPPESNSPRLSGDDVAELRKRSR